MSWKQRASHRRRPRFASGTSCTLSTAQLGGGAWWPAVLRKTRGECICCIAVGVVGSYQQMPLCSHISHATLLGLLPLLLCSHISQQHCSNFCRCYLLEFRVLEICRCYLLDYQTRPYKQTRHALDNATSPSVVQLSCGSVMQTNVRRIHLSHTMLEQHCCHGTRNPII